MRELISELNAGYLAIAREMARENLDEAVAVTGLDPELLEELAAADPLAIKEIGRAVKGIVFQPRLDRETIRMLLQRRKPQKAFLQARVASAFLRQARRIAGENP